MSETVKSGAERRQSERYSPSDPMTVTLNVGERRFACTIEDVSMDGVRLRFDGEGPSQDELKLVHKVAGEIGGQRVWQEDGAIGISMQGEDRKVTRLLQCLALMLIPEPDSKDDAA